MQLEQNTAVADRFRLIRMIGGGGMGSVWHAFDPWLETPSSPVQPSAAPVSKTPGGATAKNAPPAPTPAKSAAPAPTTSAKKKLDPGF